MSAAAPPVFGDEAAQTFADLLAWRRDVRRFRPDPVPEHVLERALSLAALAPSVGNSQPTRFVRVDDAGRRAAVLRNFAGANAAALQAYADKRAALYARLKLEGLREAPVQLAVFCDVDTRDGHGLGSQTMRDTLVHSSVCAVHTFWLAARLAGLGVGWVSILDPGPLPAILDVPAAWRFVAWLCVGWPCEAHLEPELARAGWQARNASTPPLRR